MVTSPRRCFSGHGRRALRGPVNGVKFVGQVTNAATGDPVSGIMISTGSTYTYTDAGGNYTLFGQEGSYELWLSAGWAEPARGEGQCERRRGRRGDA